jgi:glyoxylase-like metal-dependent hydrolase (beta-lactamase superfamily II)
VDTGQGTHLLETARSLHPYRRWEVMFRIELDEEIGPQLRALGVGPRDVKRVVLTHLHIDHDGGLAHFPYSDILVSRGELRTARGWMGRARGYLPNRWPSWSNPGPLDLAPEAFGPFATSRRLTSARDVIAVGTPGHTADHLSFWSRIRGSRTFWRATVRTIERLMFAGQIDGVWRT